MKKKLWLILLLFVLFACSNKTKSPFIEDEEGHKMYKNEDGIYVKNDWYEIDGDKYYFDMNGYMVTDSSIDGRYVGKDGKMKKNYWLEHDNDMYYLGEDGMYKHDEECEIDGKTYLFDAEGCLIRDVIRTDIQTNEVTIIDEKGAIVTNQGIYEKGGEVYYVKKDGKVAHDEWITIDGKDIYFGKGGCKTINNFAVAKDYVKSTESEIVKWSYIDKDGNVVKNDWISYESDWCYADENGVLLQNEWKTIDGIDYYFNKDCYMVKNDFVEGVYYVDESGKKIKNSEKVINGNTYVFDSNGKSNRKVILKTENSNWKLHTAINTGVKYISGKYYSNVTYLNEQDYLSYNTSDYCGSIITEKNDIGVFIYNKKTKKNLTLYSNDVFLTIKVNGNTVISSERIGRKKNEFLVLTQSQRNILLNSLLTDFTKIEISIGDAWSDEAGGKDYYKFEFETTGFNEIYPNL